MTITKSDGSKWAVVSFASTFRCQWCGKWRHAGCKVGRFAICTGCVENALPGALRIIAQEKEPEFKKGQAPPDPPMLFKGNDATLFTRRKAK